MDKQTYDEIRLKEIEEKEKVARNKKIKKYTRVIVWLFFVVLILSGGGWYMAKNGFFTYDPLDLCVQHTGTGMHIHPHLKIHVKDEEVEIPENIGVAKNCMRPVHTHDGSGTLHLEFPKSQDVKLDSFFKIWEKQFDWINAKMKVNGEDNPELQNYIMNDGDKIELFFN